MFETGNKYHRDIVGFDGNVIKVDVYRVLDAFSVTDPALQHLIKKALCSGLRGHKDLIQDLKDIVDAAQAALKLQQQKDALCESPNTFDVMNSGVVAVPATSKTATPPNLFSYRCLNMSEHTLGQ